MILLQVQVINGKRRTMQQWFKWLVISIGVLVLAFMLCAFAFVQFVAIPREKEIARTGRVKLSQPSSSPQQTAP
jgi:hypothetical protein